MAHRGYSDSIVSSSQQGNTHNGTHDASTKLIPACTCDDAVLSVSNSSIISKREQYRSNLRLPSFKSLGIEARGTFAGRPGALPIGALPTPPEEPLVDYDFDTPLPPGGLSRSISFTEGIIPTTPGLQELAPVIPLKASIQAASDMPERPDSTNPTSNPKQSSTNAQDSTAAKQDRNTIRFVVNDPSGEGSETSGSEDNGFITGAIPFTSELAI